MRDPHRPAKRASTGRRLCLGAAVLFLPGCVADVAHQITPEVSHEIVGPATIACGRIRFIADGEEVRWGTLFDRPAPELYHVESQKFISRIALAGGGTFAEAVERDGAFCWKLASGRYFISRVYPFQDDAPARLDDAGKFIFPGVAFRIDDTGAPAYLGTLRIETTVQRDFMRNRRMTGKPRIAVLDEFAADRSIGRDLRGVELEKKPMQRVPEIEGQPFHPYVNMPALLKYVPPLFFVVPR